MAAPTNKDRIIEFLRQHPGLDDDELSRMAHVSPRQQVNQICHRLEQLGTIRRAMGPRGKVVNYLTDSAGLRAVEKVQPSAANLGTPFCSIAQRPQAAPTPEAFRVDLEDTLVLIPCSGAKTDGGTQPAQLPSILTHLSETLAGKLISARTTVAERTSMNNTLLRPAWQRYEGSFYRAAHGALTQAMQGKAGARLMIISGGYGLALAADPIGTYDAVFHRKNWPRGLLEEVVLEFSKHNHIRQVRAFASMTTEYSKFLRSVPWAHAGIEDALMFCPEPTTGAMVRSPRAQGEGLAALLEGRLQEGWRSTDGLKLLKVDMVRK